MAQTGDTPVVAMGDGERSEIETFNLQIVSPSVGVTGPLSFPRLPIKTTVKQLKEKIREALPIKPSDDLQRLIHRGRLLAREDEPMSHVFGEDTLKATNQQTLHLVLKPSTSDVDPVRRTQTPEGIVRFPAPPRFPPELEQAINAQHPHAATQQIRNQPQVARVPTPPRFMPPPPPVPPILLNTPPNGQTPHIHQHHHQHHHDQQAVQMLQQIQQEHARFHQERLAQQQLFPGVSETLPHPALGQPPALPSFQNLIAQHQRDRAALGMQGAQQGGSDPMPHAGRLGNPQMQINRVPFRPHQTRTSTHDVSGPNGERWQVIVNETTTILPGNRTTSQAPTAPERHVHDVVQNIVRAVDGNVGAQPARSLSQTASGHPNTSLGEFADRINRPASAPPSNLPTSVQALPASSRASNVPVATQIDALVNSSSLTGPMVYILSSPEGPRGLLVSPTENGIEAFYTPRNLSSFATAQPRQNPAHSHVHHRREDRANRHARRLAEGAARAAPAVHHPANPHAGAVAAQMWPHIWLVVRLLGFVWFFTSGNTTWWRTIMVSLLALIVFIASTGVFNDVAEQVWGPIRRHLEALLPLTGPNEAQPAAPRNPGAAAPAQGQVGQVAQPEDGAQAPPDPAHAAARLLEQRRIANGNWFWTQVRRAEHAMILFLASLIPGVGERHIAARAAEENLVMEAERQRIEAAAAAAAEGEGAAVENGQENARDTVPAGDAAAEVHAPARDAGENVDGYQADAGAEAVPAQPLIDA